MAVAAQQQERGRSTPDMVGQRRGRKPEVLPEA